MTDIVAILAQQQVLTGLVGATVAGAALYSLRQAPRIGWVWLKERFAVTLTVESHDEIYTHVSVWLARHEKTKRARRLMLARGYDYAREQWDWEFTLGQGWHLLSVQGRTVLLHRAIQEADALGAALGAMPRERLTITSLGRDQDALRSLIAQAKDIYFGGDLVQIFYWRGGAYALADRRPARSVDTVFMPPAQKQRIIDDAVRFTQARAQYRARGVPYRRGYLFEGPPGTGKTTMIFVLAGVLKRSVHLINLANVAGDNELLAAFNEVGPDSLVVIEDIDTVKAARDREVERPSEPGIVGGLPGAAGGGVQVRQGVTLSGLLNAIDGIAAREGRLLFMTSNHPEHIDAALIRSGRVDVRERIDPLGEAEALRMFIAFRPEGGIDDFYELLGDHLPMSAADIQNLLLGGAT